MTDSTSDDAHDQAAANAAAGASSAVDPGQHDEMTTQLLLVKRHIAASPDLQYHLNQAETEEDFHDRLIEIGKKVGAVFSAEHIKEFLGIRAARLGDEPAATTGCTNSGCGGGYTHESSNWCTWNPIKC
jgi:hypothetical protein